MTLVAATYPQESAASSQRTTQESAQHAATRFSTPAYVCWGERIRTSDWLIQNSRNAKGRQNWVLTSGDGGQVVPNALSSSGNAWGGPPHLPAYDGSALGAT